MELLLFLAVTIASALGADAVDKYVSKKKAAAALPVSKAPQTAVTVTMAEQEIYGQGGTDVAISALPGGSITGLYNGGTPGPEAPVLTVSNGVGTMRIPQNTTPGYYSVNVVWKAPDARVQTTLLRVLVASQAELHPPVEITAEHITLAPGST